MGIFKRRAHVASDAGSTHDADRAGSRKKTFLEKPPLDSRLRQQRLPGWEPIFTPKLAILCLFLAAVLLAPIGAVLYVDSQKINELTFEYTDCHRAGATPVAMPTDRYRYQVDDSKASGDRVSWPVPQWAWVASPSAPNGSVCQVDFTVPLDLKKSVFFYYKLTNYYQAHRRYLRSMDSQQLLGHRRSVHTLKKQTCKPVHNFYRTYPNGSTIEVPIYPCGLIPNSVFNDTFYPIQRLADGGDGTSVGRDTYEMSEKGLVWPGEMEKYIRSKYRWDEVAPPPNWQNATGRFGVPTGMYTEENFFNPEGNEHFAVWMRTAGLPVIRKLYMRNDNDDLVVGRYRVQVEDNYPVAQFHGTKSFVISTANWTGGRNSFLGITMFSIAAFCFAFALFILALQIFSPKRLGDPKNLSWNKPQAYQQ